MSKLSHALPTVILILALYLSPFVVACGYASRGITVPPQEDFTAQLTQTQQALTDQPIVQNGGFESGLAGWDRIKGAGGSLTRSSIIVHSGSAALLISLGPPRAGTGALTPIIEGVSQSATVTDLRGLRVQAWYLLQTNTYLVETKLQIQAGNLKVNYYAVTSPYSVLSNTPKMKSISLPPKNCASWCLLEADVGADIRSYFDSTAFAKVFQDTQPIPIKITLEFLLYGGNDKQSMYWDDVELIASIPSLTATTTTNTSTSSISNSFSTTSTSRPLVIVSTSTLTSTETAGFVITDKQSYLVLVPVIVLILIAALLEFLRLKRNTPRRRNQLSKTEVAKGIQCIRCGANLARGDKFCYRCGSVQ
jgi:hypothetical protein